MSEITGAEALVESLSRQGVEVVFGIPGVQIMELLDAFCRMKKIRWITLRHEQTAAYAAFGYARSTGKEGVAVVVPGPGALNTCAAIGTAYAASTPVLLIAGQIDRPNLSKNRGVLHEITEQLDVFRPITKWNNRIMEVADIDSTLRLAMQELRTGRPRPVEVEVPFDLFTCKGEVNFDEIGPKQTIPIDRARIRRAAAILAAAEHPVIWAGGGVITGNASEQLRQLAELLHSPVVTTPEGKGAISDNHPLAAGNVNFNSNAILSMADVIICLGSRFFPRQPLPQKPSDLKVVQIDIDEEEIGRNWPAEMGIIADVGPAIEALLEELPAKRKNRWEKAEIARIKSDFKTKVEKAAPVQCRILRDLREELEDDSIVVCGVTNVGYWSQVAFPVYKPRTFITSSYFVTLGYSFPTALGAKIANPNKQVVAISGDGGFLFAVGDLATAVQLGLNVVTIIFNDSIYALPIEYSKPGMKTEFLGLNCTTQILSPSRNPSVLGG